jgi:hypothetical protein
VVSDSGGQCNRSKGWEQHPYPYSGFPWTAGQRAVNAMDQDGDGVIMPHETCLTPADFALIAGYGKRHYTTRPYTNANASASNSTQGTPAPTSPASTPAPPPKPTDPLADILKIYPAYLMASAESWNQSQQRFLDLSGNGRVGTLQAGTVNVGSVTGHGATVNRSAPYVC